MTAQARRARPAGEGCRGTRDAANPRLPSQDLLRCAPCAARIARRSVRQTRDLTTGVTRPEPGAADPRVLRVCLTGAVEAVHAGTVGCAPRIPRVAHDITARSGRQEPTEGQAAT
ncbi:hypothetical protein [Micromonospora sp. WMMD1082]|uniref:hypothetical protein n=1 Tax=Micromonospora sp. WMMD1082 TaxID=3016104 RepID=UPI002415EC59|nr:hypothetical protein [Micromonospora sp. WMMD1082]MDG4795209.1 hypothetical protein [Micromonospora sp. WMMD1082]